MTLTLEAIFEYEESNGTYVHKRGQVVNIIKTINNVESI